MRERLTVSFALLALLVVVFAGGVRLFALQSLLREQTQLHLDEEVHVLAAVLDQQVDSGGPVSEGSIRPVLDRETRLEVTPPAGVPVVLAGTAYEGSAASDLRATSESEAGEVTLSMPAPTVVDFYAADVWSLLMLAALVALLAGLAGWWLAVRLSRPFSELADAAGALGRGRFDVALPDTRIPEARSIGRALRSSAAQLEARLARERDFAEHASHVLRTPLTGLRLELEDLTLRDDVAGDVKDVARRCLDRVEAVDASAGELVAISRSSALVEGAETTVAELARHVAQAWSDALAGRRRVTAVVEGDPALRLTPGPVEQLLDLLRADVERGDGPVRLVFTGEESHVRVRLTGSTLPGGAARCPGVLAARTAAEAQGGRVSEDPGERDVEVLLPRR